jgi:hypothetical protein
MGFEIASDLYLAVRRRARDMDRPGPAGQHPRTPRRAPTRRLLRLFAPIIASAAGGDPVARRLQLPGQSAARVLA